MIANYHMHTSYSEDSVFDMEDVVKSSIEKGLDEICITDHIDCFGGIDPGFPYKSYEYAFLKCKEKYGDKIRLKLGIEFGMQRHTIFVFEKIFKNAHFDFVIMSCHEIEDKGFWSQEFQSGKTQEEYNLRYFQEILYLVNNFENYSVLGHLDVIRRYDMKGSFSFEKTKPIIEGILKKVILSGKGIELNTSCYRYRVGDLTPSRDILKLYKDLGGRIITTGTDSHRAEQIDSGLKEGIKELAAIGYKEFCTFTQMKPEFHSFEKEGVAI